MKASTRTITMLITLILAVASFSRAQDAPENAVLPAEPPAWSAPRLVQKSTAVSYTTTMRKPSGSGVVLVIPGSSQMKEKELIGITQDLSVMSRIVDKNLKQARLKQSPDYIFSRYRAGRTERAAEWLDAGSLLGRNGHATEAIYFDGFGALFLTRVNFPLSPPPEVLEKQIEDDVDQVWVQTKQEIYAPKPRSRVADEPSDLLEYDAERVEELKRTLTNALKHATNIRSLKPDEWVTILVRAPEPALVIETTRGKRRTRTATASKAPSDKRSTPTLTTSRVPRTGAALPSATSLTIRAKKSDIDAFSKGKLDYDQFRQRNEIVTY